MKRRYWLVLAALMLLGLGVYVQYFAEELAFQAERPDGAYRLVVYRRLHPLSFAMPGGGSDGPGRVLVVDRAGHTLHEEALEQVSLVSDVVWHSEEVQFQPFQGWSYPATPGAPAKP